MSDLCRLAALEAEVKLWAEVKAARAHIAALEAALREIVTTWDDPGRCFTMDALGKAIKKASAILEWRQG